MSDQRCIQYGGSACKADAQNAIVDICKVSVQLACWVRKRASVQCDFN